MARVTTDPLTVLAADDEIAAMLGATRDAFDALLWRRDVRANAEAVAADSIARGGRASAAIEGADLAEPDDSPMGRTLACAIATTAAATGLVDVWHRAPLQALAALHAHAAAGFADDASIGRPRRDDRADDPLLLGALPPASQVAPRLTMLAELSTSSPAPALLVAAIVHAEVLSLRPFAHGSGLVARAAVRCVLADRGIDPSLFSIPEHGMAEAGRPALVRAMTAYSAGSTEGMRAYLHWFGSACGVGAEAVRIP